jgi:molybdenum cofactor cytidylyltransferase
MGDIVGIVLGAGRSERMRAPKQLLPYAGTTLLGKAVAEAEASSLDRVVVVLGAAAAEVGAALEPSRAQIVPNLDYDRGNLSSLQVGVEAAGAHDAVVHLLGDMPGVDAELIDGVVAAWRRDPHPVAVTRYRDRVAHPFVLSSSITGRLGELDEPKSIWRLARSSDRADVMEIDVDRSAPIDVDTPEDYERLLAGLPPAR